MEETEALLLTAQSDLKSAQKRIESLHQALDMQEGGEESGEGSDGEEDGEGKLSSASSDSNYKIDQSRPVNRRTVPKQPTSSSDDESKKQSDLSNKSKSRRFSDVEAPSGIEKGKGEGRSGLRDKDDPVGGKNGGTLERKRVKLKYAEDIEEDVVKQPYSKEPSTRSGKKGLYDVDDDVDTKVRTRHHVASHISDEDDQVKESAYPRKHSADDLLSERRRRSSLLSDEDKDAAPLRARHDSTSRDKKHDYADEDRTKKVSPKHSDSEGSAPRTKKGHSKSLSFGKTNDIISDMKKPAKQLSKPADNEDGDGDDVIEGLSNKAPARQQSKGLNDDSKKLPFKQLLSDDDDDILDDSKKPPAKPKSKSLVDEDDDAVEGLSNKAPARQQSKGLNDDSKKLPFKQLLSYKDDDVLDDSKKPPAKPKSKSLVDEDDDAIEGLSNKAPARQQSKGLNDDSKKLPFKQLLSYDDDDVLDDSKKPPAKPKSKSLVDEDDDEDLELLRRRSRVKDYLSKLDLDSDGSDKADQKAVSDTNERHDTPPSEQTKQDSKTATEVSTGEGADRGSESATKEGSKDSAKDEGMSFQEKQHLVAMRRRRHRKRTIESEHHVSLPLSNEEPSSPVNGNS